MNRTATLVMFPPCLLLASCAQINNDRLVTLEPGAAFQPATGASVISVSRANWDRRQFVVSHYHACHYPTYTTLAPMSSDATTADCGCDPQARFAFETNDDPGAQMGDALAAPFIAGWEVLTMPAAAIIEWPGTATAQPPAYYDHYHQPATTFDLATPGAAQ